MDEVDGELADLSKRVRAAQRRNMMVKLASVAVVIGGIIVGFVLRSAYPVDWRGAPWLGFFLGIAGFFNAVYQYVAFVHAECFPGIVVGGFTAG